MIKKLILTVFVMALASSVLAEIPKEIEEKIRKEGMENSQIMDTLHNLTDVYGPRLTGSPKLVEAGKWAMRRMDSWGFDHTEMDPWEWGHVGWENDKAAGFLVSPVKDSLVFEVLAWTPSTKGNVYGEVVQIIPPSFPVTRTSLDAFFDQWRGKLDGKIVLVGSARSLGVDFRTPVLRIPDDAFNRDTPRRPNTPTMMAPTTSERTLSFREVATELDKFFVENNVQVRINDAGRRHGQIRAFGNRSYDPTQVVPTVVMRNEDFGRIERLAKDGKVELEFYIKNSIYPEGRTQYNTIGEIHGTKKDEVIMLGGHLDAWHSATGATDNAIGCAVMMEAARILKAIGVKPKRTIRVALWSGEEQGLLGSQAYVEKHFGSAENPKPAFSKFGGYFNIDSGTGRARAMSVFGPPEAAAILEESTKSFRDLKFMGTSNTLSRRLGGSDHTSFNRAGLPGIGVRQDPIEYGSHTWHTNLDTYERIVVEDVKASAVVVAAAVYDLAMRDKLLPRVPASEMPSR